MKLKALVLGTAMLAGVAGSAQAALLSVHAEGTAYTTPSAGGSPSNDVNPDQVGWLGANLYLDGDAGTNYVITYTFIGQEAGFNNVFEVDGTDEFTGNVTAINDWAQSAQLGGTPLVVRVQRALWERRRTAPTRGTARISFRISSSRSTPSLDRRSAGLDDG